MSPAASVRKELSSACRKVNRGDADTFRATSCPSKEWAYFLTLYPSCCEDMVPGYGSYVLYTESHSTSPGLSTSRLLYYWEINTLLAIYATCSLSICQRSLVYILTKRVISCGLGNVSFLERVSSKVCLVKPLVLNAVDRGVVMEPKQGKLASSQIDFGYTEHFCIPGVTSVFFSSCDSVVGDSLEFNQANRGSLRVWLGKRNCSGQNAGESGLRSQRGESLMGFLELLKEPGVYSRVTAGMSIRNWNLFSEVRTPV